jgi:proteasome lid subunit RPN8/RPN11
LEELTLTQSQIEQIVAHARSEAPIEACGLMGGSNGRVLRVYPAINALNSPTRYLLQPADLLAALMDMEARGWRPDPVAIYHSHPRGPETPSETDVAESFYPESIYIIIAHLDRPTPSVRGFRIEREQVSEVALRVVHDGLETGPSTQLHADDSV